MARPSITEAQAIRTENSFVEANNKDKRQNNCSRAESNYVFKRIIEDGDNQVVAWQAGSF